MSAPDVIRHLHDTHVIGIVTTRSNRERRVTPIWSVVVDGVGYLRSAYGPESRWYDEAMSGRFVGVTLGDGAVAERDRAAALAQDVAELAVDRVSADDEIQTSIDAALRAKYSREPASVAEMLSAIALGSTVRVAPAA